MSAATVARACPLCDGAGAAPWLQAGPRRMVRCPACGLVYRDPLPPPGGAGALDAETIAAEERVGARRSRDFLKMLAVAGPPGRLLDVGTGFGFFLALAGEAGWRAVGVDPDAGAVGYARVRLGVDARVGTLPAQRFPDASVDLVTFWNVLECVPDPLATLRAAHRVLAPGGRLFLRTQNLLWQRASFGTTGVLRRLGLRRLFDRHPHLTYIFNATSFSAATLRLALEKSGFTAIRIVNSPPIGGDPYLGLARAGETALDLAKRLVHGGAQTAALVSGGRWLVGPSLEAWARR
jgi:ubiquinone/menaquinone biosynthesis C-methylase UbiE